MKRNLFWQTSNDSMWYTRQKIKCDGCLKILGKKIKLLIQVGYQEKKEFNPLGFFCMDCFIKKMDHFFGEYDADFLFMRGISYMGTEKEKRLRERGKLTPKLRYEILKRDKFKCRLCGRSAWDVVLEVDHIVPISKGGKTCKPNLRTLCKECNIGKGDQEEN